MKKSKIAPNTTVMTSSEFSRWAKTKNTYSRDFNSISDGTAFEKNGKPSDSLYSLIFLPKNVKLKKKYFNKRRIPGGWMRGAWYYEEETMSGKRLYELKNVWKASYNSSTKRYYVTKVR